jgi:sigma-54-specific transcriptional regulator
MLVPYLGFSDIKDLLPLREAEQLRAVVAKTARELLSAEAVAVYVVDQAGRSLLPVMSEGSFSSHILPKLETEWNGNLSDLVRSLHINKMYQQHSRIAGGIEELRQSLFAQRGRLLAFHLRFDEDGTDGLNPLSAGTYVAFFNMATNIDSDLVQKQAALTDLFYVYHCQIPLIDAFEAGIANRDMISDNRQIMWDQLDAALAERLVGVSAQIAEVRSQVARYAPRDYCVLIQGETGTGKELVARALHRLSHHANGAFVAENCSAIPEHLIESELFGYVKGAFTGAEQSRAGLVRKASGGTLFLDEIGDLPLALQSKLLRVLQERKVRPLGSEQEIDVNFRLVTATHRDLRQSVANGSFRGDLYHRIAQLTLRLPPLRDRVGDIDYLADYFLGEIASRDNTAPKSLSDKARGRLREHPFFGNVRELQNCMIRAVFLVQDNPVIDDIAIGDVLASLQTEGMDLNQIPSSASSTDGDLKGILNDRTLREAVGAFEQDLLQQCSDMFQGDRSSMANFLRIPRRTLAFKLNHHSIQKPEISNNG